MKKEELVREVEGTQLRLLKNGEHEVLLFGNSAIAIEKPEKMKILIEKYKENKELADIIAGIVIAVLEYRKNIEKYETPGNN